jgi:ABC-type sugar transport system ATPase subunit
MITGPEGNDNMRPLVQASNLVKRFGDQLALDDVTVTIRAGEIHALLGENGAGKSTLVKTIVGEVSLDSGSLEGTAMAAGGIAMVYQELSIIGALSIRDNIALSIRRLYGGALARTGRIDGEVRAVLARANLESVDLDAPASSLSLGQRQLLEIAKALSADSEILILDEPTATLSDAEIALVHSVVRRIASEGRAVVYITHRLGEVFALADRITVMRSGRVVQDGLVADFTMDVLVTAMLGHKLRPVQRSSATAVESSHRPILELSRSGSSGRFADVNLPVFAGQVLALFGQLGSGADHIARAIAGALPIHTGELRVSETTTKKMSRIRARRLGIGFVSADRAREGVFLEATSRTNISSGVLDRVGSLGVLSRAKEQRLATRIGGLITLPPEKTDVLVGTLSGGNQQKVGIGRVLATTPRVLVLDEPTRGVDVGARTELYTSLRELAAQGAAIVVYTSDIAEIRELADVVVSVFRGKVVGRHDVGAITDDALLKEILHGAAHV